VKFTNVPGATVAEYDSVPLLVVGSPRLFCVAQAAPTVPAVPKL
jgi:hypothetical protein